MSEKERYNQMMDEIHVPETALRKVMEIDMNKKITNKMNTVKKMGAAAAMLALCLVGSNGIVYAATGHTWIASAIIYLNGEKTEQDVSIQDNGDGTITFKTGDCEQGENTEVEGVIQTDGEAAQANVFLDDDNKMRILLGGVVEEDGRKFFEYGDVKLDITEDLEDGEACGAFELDGKRYGYKAFGESGNYSIQMTTED